MPRRKTRHFPDYGRTLPDADPDWIWQRAVSLVESGRYSTLRRDGPLVRRAAKVHRAMKRGYSGRGDKKLFEREPDLISAESFENGPVLAVLEFKMRALAGQGTKAIAAHLGMTDSFVSTFQQFFFDVNDRLNAKSWIYRNVIGIIPGQELSDEQLAMRDAYQHGSSRIDPWLDYLMHRFEEHDLTTAIGRQREAFALQVIAANLPTDRETQKMLSRTLPIVEEIRRKMFQTRSARDQIEKNVAEMLKEVRFQAPSRDPWRVSHANAQEEIDLNSPVHALTAKIGDEPIENQLYDAPQRT